MQRRSFLKSAVAGSAAGELLAAGKRIPRRVYRDNVRVSAIAFGGIVVMGMEQKDADREVAASIEAGINYFDVAPSYGRGEAEEKLGPALRPHRKNVFLACKTQMRDAAGARRELERSLQRLYTDHFDLYQFHAVSSMDDVEKILAPGGAAETFVKAREEGKVRYLGFSAHHAEAAIALMERMKLDSILFPVNFVLFSQGNFGPQILAKAKEKGVARMALKALAYSPWKKGEPRTHPKCWYRPITDPALAAKALRFTLSQEITAAVPPGDEHCYRLALDIAADFKPMPKAEQEALLVSARGVEPLFKA
jgi:predicted aldo/keto reductase-like oxidoreductase